MYSLKTPAKYCQISSETEKPLRARHEFVILLSQDEELGDLLFRVPLNFRQMTYARAKTTAMMGHLWVVSFAERI